MITDEVMSTMWKHGGVLDSPTSPMTDCDVLSPPRKDPKQVSSPVVSVTSNREAKLKKDRLRKKHSKEKVIMEMEDLKRTADELRGQLSSLQRHRKRKAVSSSPVDWRRVAMVERQRIDAGHVEGARLFHEIVFAVEKSVLYRTLAWDASQSQMYLDHRSDPWTVHTLPANPTDQLLALMRLSEYQANRFTTDMYAKLPDSTAGSPFSLVLDDYGHDISFLEMFKYGLVRAPFRDVAAMFFNRWAPKDRMLFCGDNIALATYIGPDGNIRRQLYQVQYFERRALCTHRSIFYDEEHGVTASSNTAGWFVFEDMSDAEGTKCAVRGYTQLQLHATTPALMSQEYTKVMNRSTQANAMVNKMLDGFGSIALN
ncbi:hypothetical protein, variant 1 [Aphanomyces astaci]|uniref:START domain-containing protein n=2 Tax=Aphanomyces astaci TaxID=112090 RepID=W4H9I3_APHAT|nr:hypothetical protein, variant 1 [Aphanomyces astaci]ETV88685.1 hypothetical protein, variant 1 [Aphanomyces astaci]|eukprot:XP_009821085.1 hypothetical protein, variant 1 [Aphanomyces astaci]